MPASLIFRDASSRDVFTAIARFADISLVFDPTFREAPVTVDLRNATLDDALSAVAGATRTFFRVTAPRTVARHSRHAGQAPRVRGRGRPDVLPEQRRPQGNDGPAAHRARRAAHLADDGHQRAHDQGHAGAHRRGGARASSAIDKARPEVDHRRRAARGRSDAAAGVRPADCASPGLADRHQRHRSRSTGDDRTITLQALRNLTQSDVLLANLPALYYRLLKSDTNTRTLANPQLRTSEGIAGAGALRRARAGAGDDVRADRHRRHAAAADHVVQLREHRREHRHHAAHASRRRRDAGAEGRGAEHLGNRIRRAADVRQPRDQHGDPAARRRDEHAGRPDSRRRATSRWTAFPG